MADQIPTEDSVADAFKALFSQKGGSGLVEASAPEPVTEVTPEPVVAAPEASTATPEGAVEPPPNDELAALRAELEQTRRKASESIEWGRKGYLRTSNEAARAKAYLKQALENPDGVSKEEVARFLAGEAGGTPAPSPLSVYAPPQPQAPDERLLMDTSQFLFDYGLSETQAKSFMDWLGSPTSTVTERDIVPNDHYSTLRHGYERYREATSKPDPVLAQAAASVARTQREVAKSAGSAPSRIMPTPEPTPPDPMKLTAEQRAPLVERAFEELARQYMNR